eukprot:snap_masked-scaffold_9-processed-gene-4.21-mRNA-1 protein AED:1.00 eAED:1.00 QI:0/0/0/0/1/1/3/0/840
MKNELKEIKRILSRDLDEDWIQRRDALSRLRTINKDLELNTTDISLFNCFLCEINSKIVVQVSDLRSSIVKEASALLTELFERFGSSEKFCANFCPITCETLLKLLVSYKKVIANSGKRCLMGMIKHIADIGSPEVVKILLYNSRCKNSAVRESLSEGFEIMFLNWTKERSFHILAKYKRDILQTLKTLMEDSSLATREKSRKAFKAFGTLSDSFHTLVKENESHLSNKVRKELDKIRTPPKVHKKESTTNPVFELNHTKSNAVVAEKNYLFSPELKEALGGCSPRTNITAQIKSPANVENNHKSCHRKGMSAHFIFERSASDHSSVSSDSLAPSKNKILFAEQMLGSKDWSQNIVGLSLVESIFASEVEETVKKNFASKIIDFMFKTHYKLINAAAKLICLACSNNLLKNEVLLSRSLLARIFEFSGDKHYDIKCLVDYIKSVVERHGWVKIVQGQLTIQKKDHCIRFLLRSLEYDMLSSSVIQTLKIVKRNINNRETLKLCERLLAEAEKKRFLGTARCEEKPKVRRVYPCKGDAVTKNYLLSDKCYKSFEIISLLEKFNTGPEDSESIETLYDLELWLKHPDVRKNNELLQQFMPQIFICSLKAATSENFETLSRCCEIALFCIEATPNIANQFFESCFFKFLSLFVEASQVEYLVTKVLDELVSLRGKTKPTSTLIFLAKTLKDLAIKRNAQGFCSQYLDTLESVTDVDNIYVYEKHTKDALNPELDFLETLNVDEEIFFDATSEEKNGTATCKIISLLTGFIRLDTCPKLHIQETLQLICPILQRMLEDGDRLVRWECVCLYRELWCSLGEKVLKSWMDDLRLEKRNLVLRYVNQ